jgi:hypothetical protein
MPYAAFNGGKAADAIIAPSLPDAAEIPWLCKRHFHPYRITVKLEYPQMHTPTDARNRVGNTSAGITNVVAFGPKLKKNMPIQ